MQFLHFVHSKKEFFGDKTVKKRCFATISAALRFFAAQKGALGGWKAGAAPSPAACDALGKRKPAHGAAFWRKGARKGQNGSGRPCEKRGICAFHKYLFCLYLIQFY